MEFLTHFVLWELFWSLTAGPYLLWGEEWIFVVGELWCTLVGTGRGKAEIDPDVGANDNVDKVG